jgi:hypothetical protein
METSSVYKSQLEAFCQSLNSELSKHSEIWAKNGMVAKQAKIGCQKLTSITNTV